MRKSQVFLVWILASLLAFGAALVGCHRNEEQKVTSVEREYVPPKPPVVDVDALKRDLKKDEYLVYVDYKLPSYTELVLEFEGRVSKAFASTTWKKHPSCATASEVPGYRKMLAKQFDRDITGEEATIEMDKEGYRPATHVEEYAFQKEHPVSKLHFGLMAYGTSVELERYYDPGRFDAYVAMLHTEEEVASTLATHQTFDCRAAAWRVPVSVGIRFLFVRKDDYGK